MAAIVLLDVPHRQVRTNNNIQEYFGTNNVILSKKGGQSIPTHEISKETESQGSVKENTKN